MQDVVPPNERSIRNVPVPAGRRRFSNVPPPPDQYVMPDMVPAPRRRSFYLWAAAVVVACLLLGVLISTFFEGATITVHPRTVAITQAQQLDAQLDAPVGRLSFQTVTEKQETSRTIPATGTTQASRQAAGEIRIFNSYSTATQKLIANTRFEAPDGKIYRIRESVTVPGATKQADGTLAAGEARAMAYADSPGADYNRGDTRFTVPGFKGDPRFSKFYATTKSMSGGLVGTQPAVTATDLTNAQNDMKLELQKKLSDAAAANMPEGFVGIEGASSIEFSDIGSAPADDNKATLSMSATMTRAILRSADLANAIAKTTVSDYSGEPVNFSDAEGVRVSTGTEYAPGVGAIALSVPEGGTLVWQFDTQSLTEQLRGKDKSVFEPVVKSFKPAIVSAEASLRPFWKTTFPAKADQIKVKVDISQ